MFLRFIFFKSESFSKGLSIFSIEYSISYDSPSFEISLIEFISILLSLFSILFKSSLTSLFSFKLFFLLLLESVFNLSRPSDEPSFLSLINQSLYPLNI